MMCHNNLLHTVLFEKIIFSHNSDVLGSKNIFKIDSAAQSRMARENSWDLVPVWAAEIYFLNITYKIAP